MAPLAVAISGSPRTPSRSRSLAELALSMLVKSGHDTCLIDLATLPADALLARTSAPEVDDALTAVGDAHVIIAATPTYRALYTGLLKAFFDLMPSGCLHGKPCIAIQTGGSPVHSLAVEYGLRPLFMSLDGVSLAGVYAMDDEFVDGVPSAELVARVEGAVHEAVRIVGRQEGNG